MKQTKKQIKEILIGMMHSSGLCPDFEDDYYQTLSGTAISLFLEGVTTYFNIPRSSYVVHFVSFAYLDCPSDTLNFLIKYISSNQQTQKENQNG